MRCPPAECWVMLHVVCRGRRGGTAPPAGCSPPTPHRVRIMLLARQHGANGGNCCHPCPSQTKALAHRKAKAKGLLCPKSPSKISLCISPKNVPWDRPLAWAPCSMAQECSLPQLLCLRPPLRSGTPSPRPHTAPTLLTAEFINVN